MIVNTRKFGTLVRYVGPRLVLLFTFDVFIATAYVFGGWKWLSLPDIPLSIFGDVIGVIAGFRNASAYARWWEARTIWGGVVNASRSFSREVLSMVHAPDASRATEEEIGDTRRRLVLLQIAYVHALRNHLRGIRSWDELAGLIAEQQIERWRTCANIPLAIQHEMASILAHCYERGWIDSIRWANLDRTLTTLMDYQGASERIKNTPMPPLYDLFIRRSVGIYCLLLPFGMVDSLRLLTPVGSTFVGFIFMALDKIGRDLEMPFENLPHDISLSAISRNIEINLKQMLGEKQIPEPLAPVDGILW
jgi:ion channel-forming bestrophin family protein